MVDASFGRSRGGAIRGLADRADWRARGAQRVPAGDGDRLDPGAAPDWPLGRGLPDDRACDALAAFFGLPTAEVRGARFGGLTRPLRR